MVGFATESNIVGHFARRSEFWSHSCCSTTEISRSIVASSGIGNSVEHGGAARAAPSAQLRRGTCGGATPEGPWCASTSM